MNPNDNGAGDAADTSNNDAGDQGTGDLETPVAGSDLEDVVNDFDDNADADSDDTDSADDADADADTGDDADDSADQDADADADADDSDSDSDDDAGDDADQDADADADADQDTDTDTDADEPLDLTKIDVTNIEQIGYKIKPDPKYGIAPIAELPKEILTPETKLLHDTIVKNSIQAIQNVAGLAEKANDQQQQVSQKELQQYQKDFQSDLDSLVKAKEIPPYTKTAAGKIDPKSEGGKVIKEVWDFLQEHNDKNANNPNKQISSFEVAYRLWKQENETTKRATGEKNRNRKKAAMIGGSGNKTGDVKKPAGAGQGLRSGMSLDDIEID